MNRAYGYGGGVQSTAMLVLVARGELAAGPFLFANTGDDSEDPLTLAYVRDVAVPYAAEHGIDLTTLSRRTRDGQIETLYGRMTKPGSLSEPIPVILSGGRQGRRGCTQNFKREVTGKELRRLGASAEDPWQIAIGISADEYHRANTANAEAYERIVYPLLTEHRATRGDCEQIIRGAGLPVPPKSSCWFCPNKRPARWAEMRRDRPELFERACDLDDYLGDRAESRGRGRVTLLGSQIPLRRLTEAGPELPFDNSEDEACTDNGGCWL